MPEGWRVWYDGSMTTAYTGEGMRNAMLAAGHNPPDTVPDGVTRYTENDATPEEAKIYQGFAEWPEPQAAPVDATEATPEAKTSEAKTSKSKK